MARKKSGEGVAYTDEIVGEDVAPSNGKKRLPPAVLAKIAQQAARRDKLDNAAPLGFAPKGDQARPKTR